MVRALKAAEDNCRVCCHLAEGAGIDLGSERHWVCAPTRGGSGREIASFGATTSEVLRLAAWLKSRQVESVAMESTGV